MKLIPILMVSACLAALSGCHMFRGNFACHAAQEYQRAQQMPPLKVPLGMDAPNKTAPMVIPSVASDIPARGRRDACLEEPPKYKAAAPNKPLPQS
jgi:uncharacterized lipoprotein